MGWTAGPAHENRRQLRIRGHLSLRGATCPLQVDAQCVILADGLRLTGDFALRPSAFGIRPVTALGGSIRLEDRLAVNLNLGCLRDDPEAP